MAAWLLRHASLAEASSDVMSGDWYWISPDERWPDEGYGRIARAAVSAYLQVVAAEGCKWCEGGMSFDGCDHQFAATLLGELEASNEA